MKNKKILFLIPLVFLIAFGVLVLNNKKIIIESENPKKLTSYSDVLDGENSIENTENVKFDAYFLVDKNNDGIADKIRGNSLKIGSTSKLNIDLNVTGDTILKNARIDFINSNVDIGYKSSYGVYSIPLESIDGGTNKNFKVTLRSNLSNDIKSYNQTNKVLLVGTIVENGQEKEIRKEVSYIVDWYRTDLASYIDNNYTATVKTANDKIKVEYSFKTLSYTTSLLKSVNLNINVPLLNGVKPTSVKVESTNVNYNYDSDTNKLTIFRGAALNDTMIVNNVYDYKTDDEAINNFKVVLEYPVEAGYSNDSDVPLNVNVYYELYNNPDSDYINIITSNTFNRILVATSKKDDVITSINEGGPIPYLLGVSTDVTTSDTVIDKTPILNLYDNLPAASTIIHSYTISTRLYYTLGKINKLMIYDTDYDNFIEYRIGNPGSLENIVKYKSIKLNISKDVLGDSGYIKLIDADTNEVIHIFTKSDWDNTYVFENDVRKIYLETSEIIGISPKLCRKTSECEKKYENVLSANVVKEIDIRSIVNTFTRSRFSDFTHISTSISTNLEGEHEGRKHNLNSVDKRVLNKKLNTPKSSKINISLNESIIPTNESKNIRMTLYSSFCDDMNKHWINGEFLIVIPKDIIDININSITSRHTNLKIVGYELTDDDNNNYIKIITEGTLGNYSWYPDEIYIDAEITPDPRESDKSLTFEVYGLNRNFDLSSSYAQDIYDLNNNGRTNDYVNYGSARLDFEKASDVRTVTVVKIYDKNNNERAIITPKITEVYPLDDNEKAKVEISLVNNSDEKIQDIKIIGKVGYPSNTYQLNDSLLGSQFNIRMTSDGIIVPDELRDKATIYYSQNSSPTDDITNLMNNWNLKENVVSFDSILSYMIVINDYTLNEGKNVTFTYDAKMQMGTNLLNLTTYITHAAYYKRITDSGIVEASPIEQRKTGFRMVRKYKLSLTDYKKAGTRIIPDSIYILTDEDNNQKILKTDNNGKINVEGLYVGKQYKIQQQNISYPYLLDEEEKVFKVINNSYDELELSGDEVGTYKIISIDDITINNEVVLNAGERYIFNYTGSEQTFVVPKSGNYKLEVWGAQGGYRSNSEYGGKGGYASGEITLTADEKLYVYVGGSGNNGGYNGGGSRSTYSGGGGASDIRLNINDLYSRIIVAGGGGSDGATNKAGGYGGGLTGQSRTDNYGTGGAGATQTQAGSFRGTFGQGGSGLYQNRGYGGAGGGGWYGGGGATPDSSGDDDRGGGGGSGFVYTSSSTVPSGYNAASKYQLTNTSLIAGNQSLPTHDGTGSMIGNSGNGYVVITYIGNPNEATVELKYAYGTMSNNKLKYTIGSQIGDLPSPTLSNQNILFEGWYLEQRHETKVNSSYVVNEDTTLYAKYVDRNGIEIPPILFMDLENETRFDLILTNKDLDTDELITGSRFKITGKGFEEGEILRTNGNGEISLKGLYLNEKYVIEQVSSLNHLTFVQPFEFYLMRNRNGEVSISKTVNLPYVQGNSVPLNNTSGFSGTWKYESISREPNGVDEGYIVLDLTDYYEKYSIKYKGYKTYYAESYSGYEYKVFAVTDIRHIPDIEAIEANSEYRTEYSYLTTAYSYNSKTNSYYEVPIVGGKKYYIYMYAKRTSSTNNNGRIAIDFNQLLTINGSSIDYVPIPERINYADETNNNIIQTIEDSNNQDSPKFLLDVKSKSIPTYTLEITKLSADTKEPLKDAQYKITGYGLPLDGAFIKTDENGKATITLKRSTKINERDGLSSTINGFDYSVVEGTYEISEVVPPLGYQLDNRKIPFNYRKEYDTNNCNANYSAGLYNCTVDKNTEQNNALIFSNIENQFSEYEIDEENNIIRVTMYDYPLISITKKDAETNELLPNTLFAIYSVSTGNMGKEVLEPAKDSNGNILGIQLKIGDKYYNVLSTDSNGKLSLSLLTGEYKALEVQAVDEKYQIKDEGYYFSVGPTIEYDDSKIQYFGSIYDKDIGYCYYSDYYYSPCDYETYTEIIPTSDGGWLVALDASKDSGTTDYSYDIDIRIRKYDRNLNIEWESDAQIKMKKEIKEYRYYDDPTRVIYEELDNSEYGVDTSYHNYSLQYRRTYLKEGPDGYFVNPHDYGVVKFDKNGNRLWQSQEYSQTVLEYYNGICDIDTGQPHFDNEYFDNYTIIEYDPNNPYIQRDDETYYCYKWNVYDKTLEEAGGILKYQIEPDTGQDIDALLNADKKYEDIQYNITEETENIYDDNGNIVETRKYRVYTPNVSQYSNSIRMIPTPNWSNYANLIYDMGITGMTATNDGGVTVMNTSPNRYGNAGYYILSDGTIKYYSTSSPTMYKIKGNECNVWGDDKYSERSDCYDMGGQGSLQLLHYDKDGNFVSVTNIGSVHYKAVKKYNQEHGTSYSPGMYVSYYVTQSFTYHTFENGDLLVYFGNGFLRLRYNTEKREYEAVYFVPFELWEQHSPMIQIIGNSFTIKRQFGNGTVYYIDEDGNISEDVSIFGTNSLNLIPQEQGMNYNGYYRLDNGNYIVYAQLSPGYRDNLVEKGITLSREGQSVYEPLNIDDGKMYFIVYEINNNSEILWYKLYYIRDIPYDDTGYISVFYDSHPRTTIRYNSESNEMMFTIIKGENYQLVNVNNPEETINTKGNQLIFRLVGENTPEAPEAYSIEVLNERKKFNINIESGENGKAYVLNGDNTVYTLDNETKDVESIKYGDNSIYTIKAKGNTDYVVDKVYLNDEEYSYTANEDGTIVLDGINDVKENKNIKITYKPGSAIAIVHHYIKDTETKIASDEIISGLATTPYETEPTLNELYSLEKDNNGEYILPDNYKGILKATPTIVTYYYVENNVNLKTNYYKENTTIELAPSKTERKLLGSSYKTSPMNIEFYELVNVIGNEEGTLTKENTEVTYMYQEITDVTLTVKHLEKDTEKELSDTITKELKRHDKYETSSIEIPLYRVVDKTDNYKGKAEKQDIEVIYYYEKIRSNITVKYLEKDTNKELSDSILITVNLNDNYITQSKVIDNYKLIDKTNNTSGKAESEEVEVIYYYEYIEQPKVIEEIEKPTPQIKNTVSFIIKNTLEIENEEKIKEDTNQQVLGAYEEVKDNPLYIIIISIIVLIIIVAGVILYNKKEA